MGNIYGREYRKQCQYCGEYFLTQYWHKIFCSEKCRHDNYLDEKINKKEYIVYKKVCKNCHKEFQGQLRSKFCSRTCREEKEAEVRNQKWANQKPREKNKKSLKSIMYHDLKDKPTDYCLTRFKACRG